MKASPVQIGVAVVSPMVYVKISGRADFTNSVGFKKVILGLLERGYKQYTLELSECLVMDSTFLGVMVSLVKRLGQETTNSQQVMQLVNPNERVRNLLDNLGILQLFLIHQGVGMPVTEYCPAPLSGQLGDKIELTRNSLEAHQMLMAVNPANIPKFKDVAQFLAEDLAQCETPSEKPPGS